MRYKLGDVLRGTSCKRGYPGRVKYPLTERPSAGYGSGEGGGSENPAAPPETARSKRRRFGGSLDKHGVANKVRYSLPIAATK